MKKLLFILVGIFMIISIESKAGIGDFLHKLFIGGSKTEEYKIALVLSEGNLGDQGFNDMAYDGLKKAKESFDNITIDYVEPKSTSDFESLIRSYVKKEYDLIIGNGFMFKEPIYNVAKDFPETNFAVVDCEVNLSNVESLIFDEEEGSFLVGALAAMVTQNRKIGFVGGMEAPLIEKFFLGYTTGAMYIDPNIRIEEHYIGGENPFNNIDKGKEIASNMKKRGADIIFHAAGKSGIGVIRGAEEAGIYSIGVDKNQDAVAPGYVLTSMLKKVDVVVFNAIKNYINGDFTGKTRIYGISNGGIDLTSFEYTKFIIDDEVQKSIAELKNKIINDEIIVLR